MYENELRLFKLVHENDDPELAVQTAIKVFVAFLEQPQAHPEQILADLLECS